VLAFPIYWWSLPGLLKGWIDRVFVNGWAIDYGPDTPVVKKLRHLQVHLLALGAADDDAFDRHGYAKAMRTQIDYGIFDYCGAQVVTSALLLESESGGAQVHLDKARAVGEGVFDTETVAG
jgi:NAD(P)H dehydrogenase (quinone)